MNFNPHVKIRDEKCGAVMFDTLKEKVFVTNDTGRAILRLLERGETTEDIATLLSKTYDLESDEIKNDVKAFIGELREKALLGS